MSCPVVIMHYKICFITQNILQFDDWVYLIAIVGDTNGQEILLPLNQIPPISFLFPTHLCSDML